MPICHLLGLPHAFKLLTQSSVGNKAGWASTLLQRAYSIQRIIETVHKTWISEKIQCQKNLMNHLDNCKVVQKKHTYSHWDIRTGCSERELDETMAKNKT